MGVLIIIILVIVFYHLVIKPQKNNASTSFYQSYTTMQQFQTINQPTPGINRYSADFFKKKGIVSLQLIDRT